MYSQENIIGSTYKGKEIVRKSPENRLPDAGSSLFVSTKKENNTGNANSLKEDDLRDRTESARKANELLMQIKGGGNSKESLEEEQVKKSIQRMQESIDLKEEKITDGLLLFDSGITKISSISDSHERQRAITRLNKDILQKAFNISVEGLWSNDKSKSSKSHYRDIAQRGLDVLLDMAVNSSITEGTHAREINDLRSRAEIVNKSGKELIEKIFEDSDTAYTA